MRARSVQHRGTETKPKKAPKKAFASGQRVLVDLDGTWTPAEYGDRIDGWHHIVYIDGDGSRMARRREVSSRMVRAS